MTEQLEALHFYRSILKALKKPEVSYVRVEMGDDGEMKAYIVEKTLTGDTK